MSAYRKMTRLERSRAAQPSVTRGYAWDPETPWAQRWGTRCKARAYPGNKHDSGRCDLQRHHPRWAHIAERGLGYDYIWDDTEEAGA